MANTSNNSKGLPGIVLVILGVIVLAIGVFALSAVELKLPGLEVNFGKSVAMVGMFLILIQVIKTFYTQPLHDAIVERTTNLEHTFSEAENLKAEMAELRTNYERRLAETEASTREQIQAQVKEAQNLATQLRAEAVAQIEDMKRSAADEVARERDKAISELRLHVVNLTLGATEKLLGENVDNDRNRKLVDEYIDKVEVAR